MPSGRGSVPPGALGSFSRSSGMEKPRKRMPSNLSRSETSQSIEMMSRAPPTTWPTLTLGDVDVAEFLVELLDPFLHRAHLR